MVYTLASGASGGNPVEVRVLSSAPMKECLIGYFFIGMVWARNPRFGERGAQRSRQLAERLHEHHREKGVARRPLIRTNKYAPQRAFFVEKDPADIESTGFT